ncbi:MAG: sugar ABC transporter permease [Solirubrobacterales bacterium]|nr:sugar ABC transporter permease [Solirubrobacterales bacterium]MBV9685130.1 sugar ABC transporter permease [Solirubrobacterales bacterium]MBV9808543.1 sugar ABC transporter permease [Solirubrobacterales bacterium]
MSAAASTAAPGRTGPRRFAGSRAFRRRRAMVGLLLVSPALAFVGVFFLAPFVLMIWMSLHKWPLLGHTSWAGLSNYAAMGNDPMFWRSLAFTVEYTLIITPILIVVGFGLAWLIRERRRGVGFFRTVYFMPYVIGFAAASYLWVWFLNPGVGLFDKTLQALGLTSSPVQWFSSRTLALFAVVLMIVWKVVGFTMLLFMSGLQGIPDDVQEAAQTDGAGRWATLWRVTLPLLRRTIALTVILAIVGSMLAFDQFYIMTNGGPNNQTVTIVYWIYDSSFVNFQLGYGAAMSVVLTVILVLITSVQLYLLRDQT